MVLAQSADQVTDLNDLPGVQSHRRLVQNHHLRVTQNCLGDAHTLTVALGQVLHEPVRHIGDACDGHGLFDFHLLLLSGDFLGPGHKGEILSGSPVHIQGRLLRQITDEPLGLQRFLEDVVAPDGDLPGGGGKAAGHNIHGGGFTGTVGAQKAVDLALFDLKGQVRYGGVGPIPLGKMLD